MKFSVICKFSVHALIGTDITNFADSCRHLRNKVLVASEKVYFFVGVVYMVCQQ